MRPGRSVWLWASLLVAVLAVAPFVVPGRTVARADLVDSASGAFRITGSTGTMSPGLSSTLTLVVQNPSSTQLNLSSVAASVGSTVYTGTGDPAPSSCAAYLTPALPHTWTAWTGAKTVAAGQSITISEPLSFADSGTNQDVCQNVTFKLGFSGLAYYTDPTTTGLSISPSPANAGAPVTLTATVSPTYSGVTPTGTVTFSGPSGQIGAPVAVAALAGGDQAAATLTTSSLPAGSSHLTAAYAPPAGGANGGPDFYPSNAAAEVTVHAGCVTPPTTSAGTVIAAGSTYNGNYEVTAGKSLWLNGGTIKGNVTVDTGGLFAAGGGTITGNLLANGVTGVQGTAIQGSVQSSNAGLSLGYGTTVKGNVQSQGGGPACLNGDTVGGSVQLQQMSSTTTGSVCQSQIGGNLQVQNGSEPMQIGGSNLCAGNTVAGNLQVQSISGTVRIGASGSGNQSTGNILVQNNTGGGSLTANSSSTGNCLLQNNTPGIVGQGNTTPAGHKNTCNGTA